MSANAVEATARAMTPAQQRRYLTAAGWLATTRLCQADPTRLPARWHRQGLAASHMLGEATRRCLADELTSRTANQPKAFHPGDRVRIKPGWQHAGHTAVVVRVSACSQRNRPPDVYLRYDDPAICGGRADLRHRDALEPATTSGPAGSQP